MRPTKRINPGSHRSANTPGGGKGRFFVAPQPPPAAPADPGEGAVSGTGQSDPSPAPGSKYRARASVGPLAGSEEVKSPEPTPADWVDPLDQDDVDLAAVTIDLRDTMVENPADTYYQRYSSRVPGHQ